MTEKDMTLKVKATYYQNDDEYPWKATCSVYPNLEGKGDCPDEALEELVMKIEKMYTRGKFAIKDGRPVEVGYTMTSVSAEISLAVSKNKSLSEFGLEIARQCKESDEGKALANMGWSSVEIEEDNGAKMQIQLEDDRDTAHDDYICCGNCYRQQQCGRPDNGRPCQEFAFRDDYEESEQEE